jgi:hypothetical protein
MTNYPEMYCHDELMSNIYNDFIFDEILFNFERNKYTKYRSFNISIRKLNSILGYKKILLLIIL